MPEWLPYTSFKTKARELGEFLDYLEKKLYCVTRMQLVGGKGRFSGIVALTHLQERGDATSSFVADFLTDHDTTAEEQKLCQEVATTFYGGACSMTLDVHTRTDGMPCSWCRYGMRTYGVVSAHLTVFQTVSALLSFILIMAQQPQIQLRAQEEVDAVVAGRPPKCRDRESMPYLNAVLKEVYRCNPVVPLGQ